MIEILATLIAIIISVTGMVAIGVALGLYLSYVIYLINEWFIVPMTGISIPITAIWALLQIKVLIFTKLDTKKEETTKLKFSWILERALTISLIWGIAYVVYLWGK